MDKLLRDIARTDRSADRPALFLVAGTAASAKSALASRLAGADCPAGLDPVNGLALVCGPLAQAFVVGSSPTFGASARSLLAQRVDASVLVLDLAEPGAAVGRARQWADNAKADADTKLALVVADFASIRKLDPQALRISLGLLRQIAAGASAQFFTAFDAAAIRRVSAAISAATAPATPETGAPDRERVEREPQQGAPANNPAQVGPNEVKETANSYFVATPEAPSPAERTRFERLFEENVAKIAAEQPMAAGLAEYRAFVESRARCGADFAALGV